MSQEPKPTAGREAAGNPPAGQPAPPPNPYSGQPAPDGRVHVHQPTVPGEPVAPEIVPESVHMEAGAKVQADGIDVTMVALSGVFFAVALFAVVVLLQAWFYSWSAAQRDLVTRPNPALRSLLASQEQKLHPQGGLGYDPTQNAYHMSIDRAMDVMVARAGQPAAQTEPH